MLQHPEKYLYIPYVKGGGLDSKLWDLEIAINAALSMQRIPILREEQSSSSHRLDGVKKTYPINWDKYLNLSRTVILKVDSNRVITKIPHTLQYVYERDFNFNLYPENQIRFIDETQIYDKENNQYPIICLLKKADLLSLKQPVNSPDKLEFKKRMSLQYNPSLLIQFSPSEEVNILTDTVLSAFGTTREDMKVLINALYDFFPRGRSKSSEIYEKFSCYMCMHVRYGWSGRYASTLIKQSSDLRFCLGKTVKKAYSWKHRSMPLYIMSNIMEPDYFDFLISKYNIYRYTDFKELREQFIHKDVIDHNLLFSVEKNIMRHTPFKILSGKGNQFIFQGEWSNTKSGFEKPRRLKHRKRTKTRKS